MVWVCTLIAEFEVDDLDISTSFFAPSPEVSSPTPTPTPGGIYQQPLYQGAPSGLTEYIGSLLLFQYSVRHSLTNKALEELLSLMTVFLPPGARVPKTVYQLKKFFLALYPEQQPHMQRFCDTCHALLGTSEACGCGGATAEFVTVPLEPQLKARLESKLFKRAGRCF